VGKTNDSFSNIFTVVSHHRNVSVTHPSISNFILQIESFVKRSQSRPDIWMQVKKSCLTDDWGLDWFSGKSTIVLSMVTWKEIHSTLNTFYSSWVTCSVSRRRGPWGKWVSVIHFRFESGNRRPTCGYDVWGDPGKYRHRGGLCRVCKYHRKWSKSKHCFRR